MTTTPIGAIGEYSCADLQALGEMLASDGWPVFCRHMMDCFEQAARDGMVTNEPDSGRYARIGLGNACRNIALNFRSQVDAAREEIRDALKQDGQASEAPSQ